MRLSSKIVIILLMILPMAVSAQMVRVGLVRHFQNQAKVLVSAKSDITVTGSNGDTISLPGPAKISAESQDGNVQIKTSDGAKSITAEEAEITTTSDALITISTPKGSSSAYRGRILIRSDGKTISLVNIVDLEDYVKGVLPGEMPSMFKPEALKAQAVAARTYAWAHRGRYLDSGFDVCDGVHCQLYCGASGEESKCTRAVNDTAGLVMVYDGRPIDAQYCADCGGKTQEGGTPYLVSIADTPDGVRDYCEYSGHLWSKKWSLGDFSTVIGVSDLTSVDIAQTDLSGRAGQVLLKLESGPSVTTGEKIRRMFGESVVKSTMFTLKSENGNIVMKGRGFGHGIGLCQRGANGMAAAPYNCTFDQILKHYYTGVQIVAVSSVRDQPMLSSRHGGRFPRSKAPKKR